jgi:hypothetical protein
MVRINGLNAITEGVVEAARSTPRDCCQLALTEPCPSSLKLQFVT